MKELEKVDEKGIAALFVATVGYTAEGGGDGANVRLSFCISDELDRDMSDAETRLAFMVGFQEALGKAIVELRKDFS